MSPIAISIPEYDLYQAWFQTHCVHLLEQYQAKYSIRGDVKAPLENLTYDKCLKIIEELFLDIIYSEETLFNRQDTRFICKTTDQSGHPVLLLIEYSHDELGLSSYSGTQAVARKYYELLLKKFEGATNPGKITFTFWQADDDGCDSRTSKKDCPTLDDIKQNYQPSIFEEVTRLVSLKEPYNNGKIILWHGPPGNGKTHLVRAACRYWFETYGVIPEVIVDPEKMCENPKYLTNLMLSNPSMYKEKVAPFRVFIAEDCAQLFAENCRQNEGFARLLNLADGILGQGEKLVFLFTANESIDEIDEAVLRPGRCLQNLNIGNWSRKRAEDWLRSNNKESFIPQLKTEQSLADLYAMINQIQTAEPNKANFGFKK